MHTPDSPISTLLHADDILLPLCADSLPAAIDRLVRHIHGRHGGFDPDAAVAAVLARQAGMPSAVERDLAMPHARLPNLPRPRLAVGVCPTGIPAEDGPPLRVVVLLLAPAGDPNLYLRLLAAVSKALTEPKAIERIIAARAPAAVLEVLGAAHNHLPDVLLVRHVMDPDPLTLRETDTLATAIELFSARARMDLPIVNAAGELQGSIAIEDLLRLALPTHLRWMEDLTPILRFEPFAELLKRESASPITRFMREDVLAIGPDTPAIQLTKLFLQDERRQVLVTEGRRLVGAVDLHPYVRQLFWD